MKNNIRIPIFFLIILLVFSVFAVSASALTFDGTAGGGSHGSSIAATGGYSVPAKWTEEPTTIFGLRFSLYNITTGQTAGAVDIYRSTCPNAASYAQRQRLAVKYNHKQLSTGWNTYNLYTTGPSNDNKYYFDNEFGISLPASTATLESAINNNADLLTVALAILSNGNMTTITDLNYKDRILIEPIFPITLQNTQCVLTVGEIAAFGAKEFGPDTVVKSSSTASSWGFIALQTNRHFPNSIYTSNGSGVFPATSAIAPKSYASFRTLLKHGYGTSIAYNNKVEDRKYRNTIMHYASGFNGEQGTTGKQYFPLDKTYFSAFGNSSITLDKNKAVTPPKGFVLDNTFRSYNIDDKGENKPYSMPYTTKQKPKEMTFYYYYSPINYTITYKLNGGTNSSKNPATYNILYGVTLENPTREGYEFAGWYINGEPVAGINKGAKANFKSASDMYTKLLSRSTGDVTIEAKWVKSTVKYVVRHWFEDPYESVYPSDLMREEVFEGEPEKSVTPEVLSIEGYLSPEKQTVKLPKEGEKIIDYYYPRLRYTLTTTPGDGISSAVHSGAGDDGKYKYGNDALVNAFPKFGYKWSHWTDDEGQEIPYKEFNFPVLRDTKLTAYGSLIDYNIEYKDAGSGGKAITGSGNPESYNVNTATFLLKDPIKYGYVFKGWSESIRPDSDTWSEGVIDDTGKHSTSSSYPYSIYSEPIYLRGSREYVLDVYFDNVTLAIYDTDGKFVELVDLDVFAQNYHMYAKYKPTKTCYVRIIVYVDDETFDSIVLDEIKQLSSFSSDAVVASDRVFKGSTGHRIYFAHWEAGKESENVISHWASGFENEEGNNPAKNLFLLDTGKFGKISGETFKITTDDAMVPPKGFALSSTYECDGMEYEFTDEPFLQENNPFEFDFYYDPIKYNITYELNGGTNHEDNPSKYDILYGVTFKEPTKEGCDFAGWYIGEDKVSGINIGADATFEDVAALYAELEDRTTGDITVTARWHNAEELPEFGFIRQIKKRFLYTLGADSKWRQEPLKSILESVLNKDYKDDSECDQVWKFSAEEVEEVREWMADENIEKGEDANQKFLDRYKETNRKK